MARYIDEKDVYRLVEPTGVARVHCSQIDELPRADVVPKSEVEDYKHNWQKIQDSYNADCLEHYNKGRQDAAREIFAEIHREIKGALKSNYEARKNMKPGPDGNDAFAGFVDGKITALRGIDDFIDDLEKKTQGG